MSHDLDWLDEAGFIFQTAVRGRRAKKGRAVLGASVGRGQQTSGRETTLAKLRRVVTRKPEVMVKVSGSARGQRHLREHLSYVTRNGKLEGEREDGTVVIGRDGVKDMVVDWWSGRGAGERKDTRDTINLVLSMPSGTDRKAVERATRSFAHAEFGGKHDFLLVHHADTDHPHAHLTVKALGYQGQRLDPRKGDLQAWREGFAEHMRAQGVDAEATPRRARGQGQKGTKQAIRHMDKRQGSRVSKWKIEQAIKTVRQGDTTPGQGEPWRRAAQERLRKTKLAWSTLARVLDGQGDADMAIRVRFFAESFPTSVVTQRDELVAAVQGRLAKSELEQGRSK
ncbi:MAG: relaxase/mobilization nuclease domain-containing protein [Nitrospira sp.]|nr:relaxase/mobilization nuclease domain-containing protein [Nitrospira sp.]MBS0194345.1 relaxase/mobilization nuclease domain-containing protein [Pseudomonadota bacterium]